MADQDSTKKARRDAAREERRRAEEAAASAAAKAKVKNTIITVISLALVGGLLWLAIDNGRTEVIGDTILVDRAAAEAGREAMNCEVLAEDAPFEDRTHYEPASAPPADTLYTGIRPTHSGPHFNQTHPIIRSGVDTQLEERATTHSLEHGSINFYYDPEQFDDKGAVEALSEKLNDNGFAVTRAGAGIYVSPYTNPGITSGKAFAMRAWGQAVDCDGYDEDVALAFVLEYFGTHGIGPEGNFAPFPEENLAYGDGDDTETSDGATDGEATDAPTDAEATDAPTDEASTSPIEEPAPADEASPGDEAPTDESSEG